MKPVTCKTPERAAKFQRNFKRTQGVGEPNNKKKKNGFQQGTISSSERNLKQIQNEQKTYKK